MFQSHVELLFAVLCFNISILPGHALQTDLSQQHGKGDVVLVKHTLGYSVECHLHSRK